MTGDRPRRLKVVNILLGLVLVGVVAAGVLFFTTMGQEKDAAKKPAVRPRVEKVVTMSTSGIVDNIERRLGEKAGFAVTARCPRRVDEAIGTTFRCSVRRAGETERIAIARVKISGASGQFRWTSKPVPSD